MENSIKYLNIDDLLPGKFQAHFENIGDNLDNLVNSIKKYGIITPLIVRETGINQYEIILGNRRYSAAREIGLKEIPVIILNVDDEKALDIVISDNVQRKELSAKEEAYLYDKDLEYSSDENKLSDKLGIPIDRIKSKLNFIRQNNESNNLSPINNINNSINNNVNNNLDNISNNSSINQDIISLTELNKEEREENNMNNNIINNQNLNTAPPQNNQQPAAPEPTFGGRFFPSLEDQPTNMNMSQDPLAFSSPNNNQNQQPLIDLTDTSNVNNQVQDSQSNINSDLAQMANNVQNPSLQPDLNSVSNNNMDNPGMNNDIQQEQPIIPNLDALSTNIVDNTGNSIQPQMAPVNAPTAMPVEQPQAMASNIDLNPIADNSIPQQPIPQAQQPQAMPNNYEVNTSNIGQPIMPDVSQNMTNNPEQINNNNIAVDETPTKNEYVPEDDVSDTDTYEDTEITTEQSEGTSKDIIPIVNMIKSLAVNIENLGYTLNVTENENEASYTINIEVEK